MYLPMAGSESLKWLQWRFVSLSKCWPGSIRIYPSQEGCTSAAERGIAVVGGKKGCVEACPHAVSDADSGLSNLTSRLAPFSRTLIIIPAERA